MSDASAPRPRYGIDALPGELMIWILIVSELLVFGGGLLAFMAVRLTDPVGFAEAQEHLWRTGAALNTVVLVTSGYLAAKALQWRLAGIKLRPQLALVAAAILGIVFLYIKGTEYADKASLGIDFETHPFFMFYYLLTGFHAAHVLAGVVILLLVAWRNHPRNIEAAAAFWHMVDLIWVLLFPVIYLLG